MGNLNLVLISTVNAPPYRQPVDVAILLLSLLYSATGLVAEFTVVGEWATCVSKYVMRILIDSWIC